MGVEGWRCRRDRGGGWVKEQGDEKRWRNEDKIRWRGKAGWGRRGGTEEGIWRGGRVGVEQDRKSVV